MLAKPVLVVMVWRGGERFARCLESIKLSSNFFSRIVISVTSNLDSADMRTAKDFQIPHMNVDIICTGVELPTMRHQDFWVDYLESTGVNANEWIYWLAYDDQVWPAGLRSIANAEGQLNLSLDTAYFGPWAMRHEQADSLWSGDQHAPMEVWTSFPVDGPTKLPLLVWIQSQLNQPTYMQMSGSVIPFGNYLELRDFIPQKSGPMRIEMATAAGSRTAYVAEFPHPISVIYGRPNSDRANYGSAARTEDVHLLRYLFKYTNSKFKLFLFSRLLGAQAIQQLRKLSRTEKPKTEEWRVRGSTLN